MLHSLRNDVRMRNLVVVIFVAASGRYTKPCFNKHVPVRLLGSRFEARNCISDPGSQEPYRDIFKRPVK
jgi:hypothetical protein